MSAVPELAGVRLDRGTALAPRTHRPLTRTDFVKYQGASGDFVPLHHDDPYAQAAGFPSVFSVGMLQAGLLASYVTDLFGGETIRRFKVRFREQVWPGDELTCAATVADVTPLNGGEWCVVLDLTCVRQTGAIVLSGSAEVVTRPAG